MTDKKKISLRVLDGQTEFAEDEIQKLSDLVNWISKPLFYIALVAAAGYFGVNFYQDAQVKKQKAGAEQLGIVQTSFDELTRAIATAKKSSAEEKVKNDKVVTDLEGRFTEQLKTLQDMPAPYKSMSGLYERLLTAAKNDGEGSQAVRTEVVKLLTSK